MKKGFSGYYNGIPEWSGGFLRRIEMAYAERNSKNMHTAKNFTYQSTGNRSEIRRSIKVDQMTLKEMLLHDDYIEMNFSILRRIAKTSREQMICDLLHKDLRVNRTKKSYESTVLLDQLQDRVLREVYAENIVMGSGWTFFEPEEGVKYSEVTSLWKVSDEVRAEWAKEDAEMEKFWAEQDALEEEE